MLAAVVWTWWISVFLVVGALLAVAATVMGYVMKVMRPQHPTRRQIRAAQAQAQAQAKAGS